jgi:hypothetical protein
LHYTHMSLTHISALGMVMARQRLLAAPRNKRQLSDPRKPCKEASDFL